MNSILKGLRVGKMAYAVIYLTALATFPACNSSDRGPGRDQGQPEASRFTVVELAKGFDEPMKMQVLPDGSVLIVERKGAIKKFDPEKNAIDTIAVLPVFHGLEDGLLGVALDPSFEENEWVYFFYSPPTEEPKQRISRFQFDGDSLLMQSEKVLLEIPLQREECCHSAGSLGFGPNRTLYIAVGDNTNPHNPGYYNSIDERPGHEYWDAQRTASNTDDLRGKILRIIPMDDGTYRIPEGNLFPSDGSAGRPEIYAMGCRNPFSIAVDPVNGWLLWGDVGQNTVDDPSRGPISYDEWHLTNEPGFFGWPYFAGPNAPYTHFNFETGENGPFYDAEKPMNRSPNNTGMVELPPAKPALIWYSYDESDEFPHLGTGGKSPMAGPIYHADHYAVQGSATSPKFPDYYDGKWFIAEWMRDWINVLTVDEDGKLVSIEPFLPDEPFFHPIDLKFGPDGALYVLDYGTNWFAKNSDSRLVRIEYEAGNRKPVVAASADVTAGALPLTVQFSSEGTFDHDKKDRLTYLWEFGEGIPASSKPHPAITFDKAGTYTVTLTVTDKGGATAGETLQIEAGNAVPEITLDINGNRSFFWDGRKMDYQLQVSDQEDGSLGSGISPTAVNFYSIYGKLAETTESDANVSAGMELILNSDCRSCHSMTELSVGPSYTMIADRYKDDPEAVDRLAKTIISGGSGNWGGYVMSAHPQMSLDQATTIVNYILSLSKVKVTELPPTGNYAFDFHSDKEEPQDYVLKADYTDRGNPPAKALKTERSWTFRPLGLKASSADDYFQCEVDRQAGSVRFGADKGYVLLKGIDLTDIKGVALEIDSVQAAGKMEIRGGKPDGELIGQIAVDGASGAGALVKQVDLSATSLSTDLYIVYRKAGKTDLENGAFTLKRILFSR